MSSEVSQRGRLSATSVKKIHSAVSQRVDYKSLPKVGRSEERGEVIVIPLCCVQGVNPESCSN